MSQTGSLVSLDGVWDDAVTRSGEKTLRLSACGEVYPWLTRLCEHAVGPLPLVTARRRRYLESIACRAATAVQCQSFSHHRSTLRAARAFGLSPCVLAAHEIECWLERGILAVRWRAARFYSSCSIAHRDVLNRAQRCDTLCAQKPLCAFSMHPLMTWWPSQLLRLPVFRKSISEVSRRQHTYSCSDVKPLTSLREFRITNAQRFSAEKFF